MFFSADWKFYFVGYEIDIVCRTSVNGNQSPTELIEDNLHHNAWCVNILNETVHVGNPLFNVKRLIVTMSSSETAQVSSLPLPPVQYINQYTDDNIRRGRAPRPPPVIHDTYSMFGNPFNADDIIIRPLESQGIKRLYPQHFDRRRELRKLNHSLLVNFLDLLDLLVQCPDSPRRAEKVEDLSLLFIHIHHLLNEFRPHQARETLRVMMEMQRRQRIETAQRFQKHLDKVMEILQQALQMLPDNSELDSKLIIPTELFENMDANKQDDSANESCYPLDCLMCEIVDSM